MTAEQSLQAGSGRDNRALISMVRLIGCYVVGIVAGSILASLYDGLPALAVVYPLGGLVLSSPLLVVALTVFAIFKWQIQAHLLRWCLVAPLTVPVAWLAFEYGVLYRQRGFSLASYLVLGGVWERAALALVCASISSASFYLVERWFSTASIEA